MQSQLQCGHANVSKSFNRTGRRETPAPSGTWTAHPRELGDAKGATRLGPKAIRTRYLAHLGALGLAGERLSSKRGGGMEKEKEWEHIARQICDECDPDRVVVLAAKLVKLFDDGGQSQAGKPSFGKGPRSH